MMKSCNEPLTFREASVSGSLNAITDDMLGVLTPILFKINLTNVRFLQPCLKKYFTTKGGEVHIYHKVRTVNKEK